MAGKDFITTSTANGIGQVLASEEEVASNESPPKREPLRIENRTAWLTGLQDWIARNNQPMWWSEVLQRRRLDKEFEERLQALREAGEQVPEDGSIERPVEAIANVGNILAGLEADAKKKEAEEKRKEEDEKREKEKEEEDEKQNGKEEKAQKPEVKSAEYIDPATFWHTTAVQQLCYKCTDRRKCDRHRKVTTTLHSEQPVCLEAHRLMIVNWSPNDPLNLQKTWNFVILNPLPAPKTADHREANRIVKKSEEIETAERAELREWEKMAKLKGQKFDKPENYDHDYDSEFQPYDNWWLDMHDKVALGIQVHPDAKDERNDGADGIACHPFKRSEVISLLAERMVEQHEEYITKQVELRTLWKVCVGRIEHDLRQVSHVMAEDPEADLYKPVIEELEERLDAGKELFAQKRREYGVAIQNEIENELWRQLYAWQNYTPAKVDKDVAARVKEIEKKTKEAKKSKTNRAARIEQLEAAEDKQMEQTHINFHNWCVVNRSFATWGFVDDDEEGTKEQRDYRKEIWKELREKLWAATPALGDGKFGVDLSVEKEKPVIATRFDNPASKSSQNVENGASALSAFKSAVKTSKKRKAKKEDVADGDAEPVKKKVRTSKEVKERAPVGDPPTPEDNIPRTKSAPVNSRTTPVSCVPEPRSAPVATRKRKVGPKDDDDYEPPVKRVRKTTTKSTVTKSAENGEEEIMSATVQMESEVAEQDGSTTVKKTMSKSVVSKSVKEEPAAEDTSIGDVPVKKRKLGASGGADGGGLGPMAKKAKITVDKAEPKPKKTATTKKAASAAAKTTTKTAAKTTAKTKNVKEYKSADIVEDSD